jgi:hypothetical protein
MLWRAAVILVGGGFVLYRVTWWLEIRKAQRAGDTEREKWLRGRGLRLVRGIAVVVVVVALLLTALIWRNSS